MPKTTLMFSGQGSQYVGMGREYYEQSSLARDIFDRISDIRPDITKLCFEGESSQLNMTINSQPALYTVGLAGAFAYQEAHNTTPDYIVGFSLGEIPALVYSGAISIEDGFVLVCKRAEYMQQCAEATDGTMAAIVGIDANAVQKILDGCDSKDIWCANFNAPLQTVISGNKNSINDLKPYVSKNGGRMVILNVNGAFHSPYMQAAADNLKQVVDKLSFNDFKIPMYSNIDSELYTKNNIRGKIIKSITSPVKWVQQVEKLHSFGVDKWIEVGAGNVLTGLVNKIVSNLSTV